VDAQRWIKVVEHGQITLVVTNDAGCTAIHSLRQWIEVLRRGAAVREHERDRTCQREQQTCLRGVTVVYVHEIEAGHQAVCRNRRPDDRTDNHFVDDVQSLRQGHIPYDYMLVDAFALK